MGGCGTFASADLLHLNTQGRIKASHSRRPSFPHFRCKNDEQNPQGVGVKPDIDDPLHNKIRRDVLYGNLMAGGAGIEIYYGYRYDCSDLTCGDHRTRANMWAQIKHAWDFLHEVGSVPFWDMSSANHLLSDPDTGLPPEKNLGKDHKFWCLATNADSPAETTLVVYLLKGGTVKVDFSLLEPGACSTFFRVQWYDPRNGGALQDGTVTQIPPSGTAVSIGAAPSAPSADWVVLLRCIVE